MKKNIVMTEGPMFPKIMLFALPLIASGILQITFNAADSVVVGQFAGSDALASVGATTSLVHLMINLFIGISTGALIAVSYALGREDDVEAGRHAHNAIATSLASGLIVAIIGTVIARPVLSSMGTPEKSLEGAITYFRIYFAGAPFLMLYNFGSAILRANGDTKRPFLYLSLGGVLNVLLNITLILIFGAKYAVAAVAIATVSSNVLASVLVVLALRKMDGPCKISLSKVRIYRKELITILRYGIPAGIQSCMFSISNVLIQSSINSFGDAAVAGNTAATNIGGYYDICTNAFSETALTFVSRNFAAKKYDRVGKSAAINLWLAIFSSLLLGTVSYIYRVPLLNIFTPGDTKAINYGEIRLLYLAIPNFIGSVMCVLTAMIRGINRPVFPMVTTIFGVCVVRVVWIYTVFRMIPTIECVFFTYPFTWAITDIVLGIFFIVTFRKIKKTA